MGEQVLSDEQIREICNESMDATVPYGYARNVERATIAALAARIVEDPQALADDVVDVYLASDREADTHARLIADALRLALAQQEARHAEREAMWRELDRVCLDNGSVMRERELRRALGLEGA